MKGSAIVLLSFWMTAAAHAGAAANVVHHALSAPSPPRATGETETVRNRQPGAPPSAPGEVGIAAATPWTPAAAGRGAPRPAAQGEQAERHYRGGIRDHREQRHGSAVAHLTRYLSVAPHSPRRPTVLLLIARNLQELNRMGAALELYGRVIEAYPERSEAALAMIAMADLRVANPALKLPATRKAARYARDPLLAYRTALSRGLPASLVEHIRYQQILYLWRTARYGEAFASAGSFLKAYAASGNRKEITEIMKSSVTSLLRRSTGIDDHVSAASVFLEARNGNLFGAEDGEIVLKGATSLAALGLHETARALLSALASSLTGTARAEIEKARSEIGSAAGAASGDRPSPDGRWERFEAARRMLRENEAVEAGRHLAELQGGDGDEFWRRIAEYAVEEDRLSKKYPGIMPKRLGARSADEPLR